MNPGIIARRNNFPFHLKDGVRDCVELRAKPDLSGNATNQDLARRAKVDYWSEGDLSAPIHPNRAPCQNLLGFTPDK